MSVLRDPFLAELEPFRKSNTIKKVGGVYVLTCRTCKVAGAISPNDRPSVQRIKLRMLEDHEAEHRREAQDAA